MKNANFPQPHYSIGIHSAPSRRRGVVLVFVIAVLMLLVILSTAFYSTVRSQGELQSSQRNAFQAQLAAESGLKQASRHLNALLNPAVMPNQNVIVAYPIDLGTTTYDDGWSKNGGDWDLTSSLYGIDTASTDSAYGGWQLLAPPNTFTATQLRNFVNDSTAWPPYLPNPGGLDSTKFRWSWANFWVDDKDSSLRPTDEPDGPLISPLVAPMGDPTETDPTKMLVLWPYFPRGSLEHTQTPGELESLTASWSAGRRWTITPNEVLDRDRQNPIFSADKDFFGYHAGPDPSQPGYNPNFRYKLRTRQVQNSNYPLLTNFTGAEQVSGALPLAFSGYIDYRMAATDLDSRLYLPFARWVPFSMVTVPPAPPNPNDRLDPTTSYGLSNRSAILTALDTSIYDQTKSAWSAWEDLANMPIPTNVISAFATDDTPHTWGDLWLTAASNDPNLDENSLPPNNGSPTYLLARQAYLYRKYLIPREFNVYPPRFQPDLPSTDNLGRPALYKEGSISPFVPSIYDQRPALNIDTAPLEVLVANFAAVLQEDGPPSSSDLGGVDPLILADRIASCRPFFSRVDWEDFLAANLDDADFANIYGNLPARMIDTTTDIAIADSGGPKGNFVPASTDPGYATIVSQNVLTGIPGINIVGTQARMQWFRNQIVATGSPRLTARGFNALLSASWKSPSLSYYAKTANLTYDEDTHNPGHPLYLNVSWKQGGADYPLPSPPLNPTGSIQVPMVQLGSWKPGIQTGVYEWNLAGNGAAAGAAWDSSGTSNYMVPTGGDIPDAWGSINKTEPVIIAMPIKLRSYLFEVFTRGRYIQIVNQVPTVRAVQKLHAVYDSVNKVVWMRRELGSDKGALSDP